MLGNDILRLKVWQASRQVLVLTSLDEWLRDSRLQ